MGRNNNGINGISFQKRNKESMSIPTNTKTAANRSSCDIQWERGQKIILVFFSSSSFLTLSSLPHFFFFSFLILNQGILAEWTSGSNKALENFIFIWCHCDTWLYSRIRCEMAIYHHPSKQECQEVISLVLSNLI